jgi:hypothetical protein
MNKCINFCPRVDMMTEHEAGRSAAAEVRFHLVDAGRTDAPLGGGE